MTAKGICVLLGSSLVLSACGGGSGDSTTPTSPTNPPQTTTFKVTDYPTEVAVTSLSLAESVLQVGFFANDILRNFDIEANGAEKSCSNGGLATIELIDKDDSKGISVGDSLNMSYRDCYIQALDSTVNGEGSLTLSEYQQGTKVKGSIDISNLQVNGDDNFNLVGQMLFENNISPLQRQLNIQSKSTVKLVVNSNSELSFTNLSLTRVENFSDATYAISGKGQISVAQFNNGFGFEFTKPLKGHFNEFPHEGSIVASTSAQDSVQMTSNFVTDSKMLNVNTTKEAYMVYWSQIVEGSLWHLEGGKSNSSFEFRSDNFNYVGMIEDQDLQAFPVSGGTIRLLMSRPIKDQVYESSFDEDSWPYRKVAAKISVNGAILNITPETDLKANTVYRFNGVLLESKFGAVANTMWSERFKTSDAIIIDVAASSYLYKANDTPKLDASQTVMNKGSALTFKWVDVNNVGIVFSNPTSAKTGFTVPNEVTSDVAIKLEVSNGQGYQVFRTLTIHYYAGSDTFMHYVSPQGDYIGGGKTVIMDSSSAVFTPTNYDNSLNAITLSIDGNTWWSFDIAAPAGENLQVKKYINATRYPFQGPLTAGLSFTGDGRGCNQSIGDFEVLELSYNADKSVKSLAVNFNQRCENTMPPLNGVIRYHSSVGINH